MNNTLNLTWVDLKEVWDRPLEVRVQGRSMEPTLHPGDRVSITPVTTDDLRPGDIVLLRHGAGGVLHRYLGRNAEGALLTRGDHHRLPDAPWPATALVGRATAWTRARDGRVIHADAPAQRWNARYQLGLAQVWRQLYRLRALLPVLLAFLFAGSVLAAVTLTQFTATLQGNQVQVYWETASEVDLIGFYLSRAVDTPEQYTRITDLIPSEGSVVGAPYSYEDTEVQAGKTYYYLLEAVDSGGNVEAHGPVSVTLPGGATATPGLSPTPTRTPTPGPSPTPTSATPTRTATPRPTNTPVNSATPTPRPAITPTKTATPRPTFTPVSTTPTAAPTATVTPAPGVTLTATPSPVPAITSEPALSSPTPAGNLSTLPAPTPTRPTFTPGSSSSTPISGLALGGLVLLLLASAAFWWWRSRRI